MMKTAKNRRIEPVPLTDEGAAMIDYVRSPEGRNAIERGLSDIREGRVITGAHALSVELKRRAAARCTPR